MKFSKRFVGLRPEDAVDAPGAKTELRERHLEIRHVVSSLPGLREKEESVAQTPARLVESFPGRAVHDATEGKSPRTLERFDERDGVGVVGVDVASGTKP